MTWKKKLEDKIKQDVFLNKFKSTKDIMLYLESYYSEFFAIPGSKDIIQLIKDQKFLSLKVYDNELNIDENVGTIIFSVVIDGTQKSIGRLILENMMFSYNHVDLKDEIFSDGLLEKLAKEAFFPLVGSNYSFT